MDSASEPVRDCERFVGSFLPTYGRTRTHAFSHAHDPRLPMPGTVLTREFKGRLVRVTVLDEGFEFEGRVHRPLSAIAELVTGTRWNGFLFFGLTRLRGQRAAAYSSNSARGNPLWRMID